MTSDTASSFYKILKDETNQKILVLINSHGSLSYTDLLEKSEVISERMLNYHIKALDDLLIKNEKNQYILTKKGQTALKTLKENSELIKKFERKKQKQIGYTLSVGCIIILITSLALYSQGYSDIKILRRIGIFIIMSTMFYIGSTLKVASLTSEKAKKTYVIFGKLFGIVFGGIMGMIIVMVGTLIATVISIFFDGPNFLQITSSNTVLFCSYVCISAVVGCITGYYIGKKITQTRL